MTYRCTCDTDRYGNGHASSCPEWQPLVWLAGSAEPESIDLAPLPYPALPVPVPLAPQHAPRSDNLDDLKRYYIPKVNEVLSKPWKALGDAPNREVDATICPPKIAEAYREVGWTVNEGPKSFGEVICYFFTPPG